MTIRSLDTKDTMRHVGMCTVDFGANTSVYSPDPQSRLSTYHESASLNVTPASSLDVPWGLSLL